MNTALLIPGFKSYLQAKNYSVSTIKNYLSDLNKYATLFPTLDADSLIKFLQANSTNPNYSRLLASLRLFCQFATGQQAVAHNPLKAALKMVNSPPHLSLDQIISDYSKYLASHKASKSTIKNYLNDLYQYITWLHQGSPSSKPQWPNKLQFPKFKLQMQTIVICFL